ncbi:MAG: EamA family transporter, partial [Mycobacteriales bacterium]
MQRQGFLYGLAAYLLWGTFPLYFPLLDPASTAEVLACRFVFTALFCGLVLLGLRRLRAAVRLGRKAVQRLAVASVLIGANWGLYIWGVDHGHVVECSLGYFINPLVTVGLG